LNFILCCSDLGCHIDGFIATQAQTVLVASSFDAPITGKAADLVEAARTAFNAAIRLIKPGVLTYGFEVRKNVYLGHLMIGVGIGIGIGPKYRCSHHQAAVSRIEWS
jgi:hypothetical protein